MEILELTQTNRRTTGANSTFSICGVSCPEDSIVVAESSLFRINIFAGKTAYRKSANR